jgi:DNA transformation protein
MGSARNEFVDYVVELMAGWSAITARKMFGGYGLYREGVMFALIADDELFFKVDSESVGRFERADCRPFVYARQHRAVQMSYWSAPEASLESPAEMIMWCQTAYGAALRARTARSQKTRGTAHETAI